MSIKKKLNKTNENKIKSSNNKIKKKKTINIVDSKLKVLRPTLREKKRFIKVKLISSKKFLFKELSENLIEEIILYIGSIDFGKGGIWILRDKFDYDNQEFILKVGVKFKDKLVGVLSLINKIDNDLVNINIIRVSGTLKGVLKSK